LPETRREKKVFKLKYVQITTGDGPIKKGVTYKQRRLEQTTNSKYNSCKLKVAD
jgi:hypothetical protein